MSFFGFGSACEVDIALNGQEDLPQVSVRDENKAVSSQYLFTGSQSVAGTVSLRLKPGKRVEHIGIKIELIGQIELLYDRANAFPFTSLVRELEAPGELVENKTYAFEFANVEKLYETYSGNNVRLRYFLRVKITRQYQSNISKVLDFAVQNIQKAPEINNSIKMEVGIEDCLHIEFEYQRSKYFLNDVIVGKIFFLLVRIRIKLCEVVLVKRESTGSGPNTFTESENIAKFELMDGAPVRGESIPIRMFLAPYDLTPTMRNVHNRFSVRYHLNLVLIDHEDRRYFKAVELTMLRRSFNTTQGLITPDEENTTA